VTRNHVCKSLPIDRKQEAESMKTIAIVGGLLMALTACTSGGGTHQATATTTVTVTAPPATSSASTAPITSSTSALTTEAPADNILTPGKTIMLNKGKHSLEVTLHSLSYPAPKQYDDVPHGKSLVLMEMKLQNLGPKSEYGTITYPSWIGTNGRYLSGIDSESWDIAPSGHYASPAYSEELPDTVPQGAYVQGFSMYYAPSGERGTLVFPWGHAGTMKVPVDPPN
jgi:hypothetical protein